MSRKHSKAEIESYFGIKQQETQMPRELPTEAPRIKHHLTFAKRLELHNALSAVEFIRHTDGTIEYPAGTSDALIAQQILPEHKGNAQNTVAHHRNEHFGKLARGKSTPETQERMALEERISRLEKLCHWLATYIGADMGTEDFKQAETLLGNWYDTGGANIFDG